MFCYKFFRKLLLFKNFFVNTNNKSFFIITAIENSNTSTLRQTFQTSPHIIVIEIFACRSFERKHLAALRIYSRHYMFDCSIFTGSIHCLKN